VKSRRVYRSGAVPLDDAVGALASSVGGCGGGHSGHKYIPRASTPRMSVGVLIFPPPFGGFTIAHEFSSLVLALVVQHCFPLSYSIQAHVRRLLTPTPSSLFCPPSSGRHLTLRLHAVITPKHHFGRLRFREGMYLEASPSYGTAFTRKYAWMYGRLVGGQTKLILLSRYRNHRALPP